MKVIHTISTLRADYGGPVRSVTALAEALSALRVDVEVVAGSASERGEDLILPIGDTIRTHLTSSPSFGLLRSTADAFGRSLSDCVEGESACVVHDHGIWLPANHAAAVVSRRKRLPRIVSPRGMLSEWALRHKRWKKKPAWHLYQQRDLRGAQALHATSEDEVADIRRAGLTQPIALVRNGVRLPHPTRIRKTSRAPAQRTALFLSRIHPKKGIPNLLTAWGRIRPPGWRLVIAGPDDGGHLAEVTALAGKHGLTELVDFVGEAREDEKWELYDNASLFVLPTFSENFGIVIAEALASGVPVITTTAAPWRDLQLHRCGWWIDPTVAALEQALRHATAMDGDQLAEMGTRGRCYVERELSWARAARALRDTYEWLLGGGTPPPFIIRD